MKRISAVILILALPALCYAEDISISADVDGQEITLDEQLTLTITVTGNVANIPQPQIPALDGFTAYSSGRSQNISIINGQVTSSVSFTYVLVPNDPGDYRLGPFTINYKGNTYSAGPINVKVLPKAARPAQPPSYTYPQTPAEDTGQRAQQARGQNELFIETYVDKLRAYVNEQITLTFAFYQAVDLFENPVYSPPSTTGFWTEDMPPQKKYYKVINGKRYLVTEIKTALFATSPGEFTIGPARLEANVEDLERFFKRGPFDIFNGDPFSIFRRGKPIILTTDPITVEIVPLPEQGKPGNFKGDVGRFDITAGVDKDTVEENQPVTLKIKIRGEGNIKTISAPQVSETPDFKFYDSGTSENISKENYVVQGEKIIEKVIIPKRPGSFNIGPIEYSHFDPKARKYVEKTISPITINATKRERGPEEVQIPLVLPGLTKEEVQILKKDICYIKTAPVNLRPRDAFLYKNKIFFMINALPLLFLTFLYIYGLHRERLRTDIGYARSRRARRLASKRLRQAKGIMSKQNVKEFYAEIYRAVIEYIADKLNIPHASITKDTLEERLKEKGASGEIVEKLKDLFDICDMARFASGRFTKEDMHKSLEEASDIITELDGIG